MTAAADKLIADRGHGMSPRMRDLLAHVQAGEVVRCELKRARCSHIVGHGYWPVTATITALQRRGLVVAGERDGLYSTWQLTSAGRTLLARMGGRK